MALVLTPMWWWFPSFFLFLAVLRFELRALSAKGHMALQDREKTCLCLPLSLSLSLSLSHIMNH
jgi:hypothetical protein